MVVVMLALISGSLVALGRGSYAVAATLGAFAFLLMVGHTVCVLRWQGDFLAHGSKGFNLADHIEAVKYASHLLDWSKSGIPPFVPALIRLEREMKQEDLPLDEVDKYLIQIIRLVGSLASKLAFTRLPDVLDDLAAIIKGMPPHQVSEASGMLNMLKRSAVLLGRRDLELLHQRILGHD